jgi:hypothetical protein
MRHSLRAVIPGLAALPGGILVVLLAASPGVAQVVQGTITDAGDQTPIPTVEVSLLDEGGERRGQVVTDSLGEFQIQAPAPGRYQFRVSRIGYATRTTAPFTLERGETLTLEIALSAEALHLEPLEVVEQRRERTLGLGRFYDRAESARRSGVGRVYFREDLEGVGSIYGLYRMNTPRPGCPMTILVDNLPVSDPRDLDYLAEVDRVEGVEIYRSLHQIPQEYQSQRHCALMLVWTRPAIGNPFTLKRVLTAAGAVAAFILLIRLR